jgi:RNA polymerase sigma-70 factor, ECF subfamily
VDIDLALVARRVQRGDPSAFRTIVVHTQDRLYRLAARIMGSAADAEDVMQEAYVKAYRALRDGRFGDRAELTTWLRRVVVNACIDALRRRAARPIADDSARADDAVAPHLDPEARAALRDLSNWLGELPPEQRAAIVLCAVEGLTTPEAAEALGCSVGAVEQRLVRARATLRRKRSEHEPA